MIGPFMRKVIKGSIKDDINGERTNDDKDNYDDNSKVKSMNIIIIILMKNTINIINIDSHKCNTKYNDTTYNRISIPNITVLIEAVMIITVNVTMNITMVIFKTNITDNVIIVGIAVVSYHYHYYTIIIMPYHYHHYCCQEYASPLSSLTYQ